MALRESLFTVRDDVTGVTVNLGRIYRGRRIRFGSLYRTRLLRIWRFGYGRCESRWMDEHITVEGRVQHISGDFIDDNLKNLTWWVDKHNKYSSREAVDLLNLKYGIFPEHGRIGNQTGRQAALKRWLKEVLYAHLPLGLRAFLYFFYRYVIRLGFLDGAAGTQYHFLQALWYRYLVDAKVAEVERLMTIHHVSVVTAIKLVLGIALDIGGEPSASPRMNVTQVDNTNNSQIIHCSQLKVLKIVAVILTLNEEKHLARCIASLTGITSEILVVDCFSTDSTLAIAHAHGARVIQRPWVNYATQFNWALTQLDADTDWVLRIDADEILTPKLGAKIVAGLQTVSANIDGVYFGRRMTFQQKLIEHGGLFPMKVLRLFRYGRGHCENRWMDEHIKVTGSTLDLSGELIDDNLNTLSWWTSKHNSYASREAVDLLNLQYDFLPRDTVGSLRHANGTTIKRWVKEEVYARLPFGYRAFAYFIYRYYIRLGFLDGRLGSDFHFLQGLWYRYLVDAKIQEVKHYMNENDVIAVTAIDRVLGLRVS